MKADTQTITGFAAGGEIEVPCDRIDTSLDELWRAIAKRSLAHQPTAPANAPLSSVASVHRACLLNLVIHAGDQTSEVISRYLASSLTDRFPARIVLIRARPLATASGVPRAFVAAARRPDDGGDGDSVAGELVRIDASGEQLSSVPAVVRAALETDVATTLWWTGPPPPNLPYVRALRDVADRVIIDSEALADDADVEHLLPASGSGRLADLAWPRLAPWRVAIARAFDPPAHRAFLRQIVSVQISLGAPGGELAPEASAAPLLAGWLAATLGWRGCVRGDASVGATPTGRSVCFAGDRKITLSIVSERSRHRGVVSVKLESATGDVLAFRRDAHGTQLETLLPAGFAVVRTPAFREQDPVDILGATLLEAWSDPIAPSAIRRGAEIAAALGAE